MAQVLICELKQEIENLKKANYEIKSEKDKISINFKHENKETERLKNKIHELDQSIKEGQNVNNDIKFENQQLISDIQRIKSINAEYEKKIEELSKMVSDYSKDLESYQCLDQTYNELRIDYSKLIEDNDYLKYDIAALKQIIILAKKESKNFQNLIEKY